ncbi:hypothetical protein TNCV_898211 [Trichonephila clavipes]|nr:hypothetical protein TNCV_898211 [Trichonephila clavipes]
MVPKTMPHCQSINYYPSNSVIDTLVAAIFKQYLIKFTQYFQYKECCKGVRAPKVPPTLQAHISPPPTATVLYM